VALFHDARGGEQAGGAGDKDGLSIAVAERFKLAQPAIEDRSDAVKGQLGMNAEQALRLAVG